MCPYSEFLAKGGEFHQGDEKKKSVTLIMGINFFYTPCIQSLLLFCLFNPYCFGHCIYSLPSLWAAANQGGKCQCSNSVESLSPKTHSPEPIMLLNALVCWGIKMRRRYQVFSGTEMTALHGDIVSLNLCQPEDVNISGNDKKWIQFTWQNLIGNAFFCIMYILFLLFC